ncbi:uncharacterized protein LOC124535300 [Vanessa cardui]|uniref:uncharacterized protein LOC124535300 n=1 Tax=Vanessa cardui TaxID=171605 RepID=UPI001F13B99F|nr:uncharacterized protein LOC124535300 [Vanessa cardui]
MEDIVENVTSLYKQGDWKTIVANYRNHPQRNKVLWVYPTEENFEFIANCMVELKCQTILSIGCGSGLLEWMITEATGYHVTGIEVDGAWWRCKYAPPTFVPIVFTGQKLDESIITLLENSSQIALLFCYFNNGPAFKEYLDKFAGKVLIIIGPGDGKGVHTDPRPFGDVPEEWILHDSQEVENSKDYIAVYHRK